MTEEARQARNKYQREWRAKNKDKVRNYNQRKWEKKAKEAEEQQKESDTNGRTE